MNRGQLHDKTQKKLEIAQRRKVVAANLLAGSTYAEIAAALNVSKATIASDYKAILGEWREMYSQTASEYLHKQMRRLDILFKAVWVQARDGDRNAIATALSIIDRQANLIQSKNIHITTEQTGENNSAAINITVVPGRTEPPAIDLSGLTRRDADYLS